MKGLTPLRLYCPPPPTILYPTRLKFYLFPLDDVKQTLETKLLNLLRHTVVIGLFIDPQTVLSSFLGYIFNKMGLQIIVLPSVFLHNLVLLGISLNIAILLMEDSSIFLAGSIVDTILDLFVILKLVLLLFYLSYILLIRSFGIITLSSFLMF